MSQGAAMAKTMLAAIVAAGGLLHLFRPPLSKWLINESRGRQMHRRRDQAQSDPTRNVPIEPR